MKYAGTFMVEINGERVAKSATVGLNMVWDADRNETFQLSVTTLISKAEYQALVHAHMNRKSSQIEANSRP